MVRVNLHHEYIPHYCLIDIHILSLFPLVIFRYRGGEVDNQFRTEDGSYFVPNINPSDGTYASADGVEYYCTATNDFGTIRSRTARAFIASE